MKNDETLIGLDDPTDMTANERRAVWDDARMHERWHMVLDEEEREWYRNEREEDDEAL